LDEEIGAKIGINWFLIIISLNNSSLGMPTGKGNLKISYNRIAGWLCTKFVKSHYFEQYLCFNSEN